METKMAETIADRCAAFSPVQTVWTLAVRYECGRGRGMTNVTAFRTREDALASCRRHYANANGSEMPEEVEDQVLSFQDTVYRDCEFDRRTFLLQPQVLI